MTTPLIEAIARAISLSRGLSPDALYQHHEHEDWPEDHRNEYVCAITGKPMVAIFHRAWRRHEAAAQGAITALTEAGMVIVPREPTEAMLDAMRKSEREHGRNDAIYRAMINAADHIMPPPMRDSGPLESEEGE